jgi:hypothetical protein
MCKYASAYRGDSEIALVAGRGGIGLCWSRGWGVGGGGGEQGGGFEQSGILGNYSINSHHLLYSSRLGAGRQIQM